MRIAPIKDKKKKKIENSSRMLERYGADEFVKNPLNSISMQEV